MRHSRITLYPQQYFDVGNNGWLIPGIWLFAFKLRKH